MCNPACISFVERTLKEAEVRGRRVLEIGSLDVNGSVRPAIRRLGPLEYTGVDLAAGPGVDSVCRAEDLLSRFSPGTFGVVACTEVLEHVRDWRLVVSNMKTLLAPDGVLLITTRSLGFAYHAFPYDFWRYEAGDMREIFSDLVITDLEPDPLAPGIFMKAVKKMPYTEKDLGGCELYSIIKGRRAFGVTSLECYAFYYKHIGFSVREFLAWVLPRPLKDFLKKVFGIR